MNALPLTPPRTRNTWLPLALIAYLLLPAAHAPAQIIRLGVPRDRLNQWLPPDREPRTLPRAEFEALAQAAARNATLTTSSPHAKPLLLSATHIVRWENGVLFGESRFRVRASQRNSRQELPLDPWSPAVDPSAAGDLRSLPGGSCALIWQGSGDRESKVNWRQAATPGSHGLDFPLALPHAALDVLELHLPSELEPSLPEGTVLSSARDSLAGRAIWKATAPRTANRLRLRARRNLESPQSWASTWLAAASQVQLDDGLLRHRADLSIDFDPNADRSLELQLPDSLELISIDGPSLLRSEPAEHHPKRFRLIFNPDAPSTSQVVIQALGQVPEPGPWSIPALLFPSAVLRESQTRLTLDRTWLIDRIEPLAGALAPHSTDANQPDTPPRPELTFVSSTPGPVARIHLERRAPRPRVQIEGRLNLEPSELLASALIRWVDGSRPPAILSLEIDDFWKPLRILWRGDPPTPAEWSSDPAQTGTTRLLIRAPDSPPALTAPELEVVARSDRTLELPDFPLPHFKPRNIAIIDDRWSFQLPKGWVLLPRSQAGCAWIHPDSPAAASNPPRDPVTPAHIAWRWLDPLASARVACALAHNRSLTPDALAIRLNTLSWRLNAIFQPEFQDFEFHWDDRLAPNAQWEWVEINPGDAAPRAPHAARPLQARRIGPNHWRLVGSAQADRAGVIVCNGMYAGSPPNPLPVIRRKTHPFPATRLLIASESGSTPRLDPSPVRLLDRWPALQQIQSQLGPELSARLELDALAQSPATLVAELSTPIQELAYTWENQSNPLSAAWIPHISAHTRWLDPHHARHAIEIAVFPRADDSLDLTLLPGVRLDHLRRDGRPVSPLQLPGGFRVPLQSGRWTTLQIELQDALASSPQSPRLRWPMAEFSTPVTSATWSIASPHAIQPLPHPAPDQSAHLDVPLLNRFLPEAPGILSRPEWQSAIAQTPIARGDSFMEFLVRLQERTAPLLVDRFALDRKGLQAGSRWDLPPGRDPSVLVDPLREFNLSAWIGPEAILIHDRTEDLPDRSVLLQATRAALRHGQDPGDRFQTLDRFRLSRGMPATLPFPLNTDSTAPGLYTQAQILSVDMPRSLTWTWLEPDTQSRFFLAALLLLLAVSAFLSSRPKSWQRLWLGSLIAAALVLVSMNERSMDSLRDMLLMAAGFTAVIWIGFSRSLAGSDPARPHSSSLSKQQPPPREGSSLARRAGAALVLLAECLLAPPASSAQRPAEPPIQPPSSLVNATPILALFPFEGEPDPENLGERVFLSRSDEERLRRLAGQPLDPPPQSNLWFEDAVHEFATGADGSLAITHRYDLHLTADGPVNLTLPAGEGVAWNARLDDRPIPLRFGPAPRTLTVELTGAGPHRLEIHRSLLASSVLRPKQDLQIAVLPVASAQVLIASPPQAPAWQLRSAQSDLPPLESRTRALVGPTDTITLRVSGRLGTETPPAPTQGRLDATWLWQVMPAGERILARWQNRGNERIDRISMRLDPQITLRLHATGVSLQAQPLAAPDASREVNLLFEPPLPPGANFEIEFWKPAPDPARRVLPRIELRNLARHSGILGLARPDRDPSRLKVPPALALSDQLFQQAWGSSPDPGFTFAGALRFDGMPEAEFLPQPLYPPLPIQPTLRLELQDGRLLWDLLIEGPDLRSPLGTDLMLDLPPSLVIAQIQADRFESWELSPNHRLLLHPRPEGPPIRNARVIGWIPLETSSNLADAGKTPSGTMPLPWPAFPGSDPREPTLLLVAEPFSLLEPATDTELTRIPLVASEPLPPGKPLERAYRLNRAGTLRWQSAPPACDLQIDSRLEFLPGQARWTASLQLTAQAGPLAQLTLRMPADWDNPRVSLDTGRVQLDPAPDPAPPGTRDWILSFSPPLLGTRHATVQSHRDTTQLDLLSFPDLLPIGMGRRSLALRWLDLSGERWFITRQSGMDNAAEPTAPQLAAKSPRSPTELVARALSDRWSLEFARPVASTDPLDLVDTLCASDRSGALVGQTTCWKTQSDSQPLRLRLPGGIQVIDALADAQPVFATAEDDPGPGSTLTLRFPRPVRRVDLLWKLSHTLDQVPPAIPLPEPLLPARQWLLTCFAPENLDVHSNAQSATRSDLDYARLDAELRALEARSAPTAAPAPITSGDTALRLTALERRIKQARTAVFSRTDASRPPEQARWLALESRRNALAAQIEAHPTPAPDPRSTIIDPTESPWELRRPGIPSYWISARSGIPSPPPTLAWAPSPRHNSVVSPLAERLASLFHPLPLSALCLAAVWLLTPLRAGWILILALSLILLGLFTPLSAWAWILAGTLAFACLTRPRSHHPTPADLPG